MAIPTDAILRAVVSALMPESVIAMGVFNVQFKNTGGSNDDDDVVSDLVDWLEAVYTWVNGSVADSVDGASLFAYIYDSLDDDWDEIGSEPWVWTPTNAGDMMPHGCSAIVHGKTTDPDVQGTKFIPGYADGAAVGSSLTPGDSANALNFAGEWVAPFVGAATGSDFDPGVWSPTDTAFYLFNLVYSVNGDIGYQRRRKPGVGI